MSSQSQKKQLAGLIPSPDDVSMGSADWVGEALLCSCSEDVVMGRLAGSAKLAVIRENMIAAKNFMATMKVDRGSRIERVC